MAAATRNMTTAVGHRGPHCGFRGREDAAAQAADDDHGQHQRPERIAQRLQPVGPRHARRRLDAAVLARPPRQHRDQRQAHHQPGRDAREK
ncbi:hypothetical protein G6F57_022690 [Rhizopus arrhizus]|nr:hypothetical protein G6F57_022690 [Rhizopus arrhizus]